MKRKSPSARLPPSSNTPSQDRINTPFGTG
ncbi:hypothetical protein CKAH01_02426 [Colletotrichum kahawae]|uniref:Uncharacterized protein n=1 Tax=Colletotrichum kahawae TaxID=34407 RepID=A0AAD9Y053_COLKA|nr:hypothetical protein CKAH01_02426 [Colletotrichum kahawae]